MLTTSQRYAANEETGEDFSLSRAGRQQVG